MNIKNITIENFRGVRNFSCDCSSSLNVFAGINGAGKSTVLCAVDILMGWLISRLRNAKGRGYNLVDSDITQGCDHCLLKIVVSYKGEEISWKLYKQKSTVRTRPADKTSLEQVTMLANDIISANEADAENASLPLFATYGVTRVVDSTPVRIRKRHAMAMIDTYDSKNEGQANYRSLFAWFRELEDIENANLRETGVLTENRQLKAVRQAIVDTVPGFDELKVKRSPRGFVIKKYGQEFRFDQLSDGEKAYIAIVADIARKLGMTHPSLADSLQAPGIVMIDEVDLHLHPSWQRDVVPQLAKTFPYVQFFMTTHSPYVLTNVNMRHGQKVFFMRDGKATEASSTIYGKRVDNILCDNLGMMSVRGKEVEEKLSALMELMKANDISSAEYLTLKDWLAQNVSKSDPLFADIAVQECIIRKKQRG